MKKSLLLLLCLKLGFLQVSFSQTIKTVGDLGDYNNLRVAFNAINNGLLTGNIELQIISDISDNNTAKLFGSGQVGEITAVSSGGTGYVVGDILTFSNPGAGGTVATARVATVNAGVITGVQLTNPGSGYSSMPTVASTSGSGTGAGLEVVIGGNFSSLTIYPTVANLVISGFYQEALIELNGADNVTFDGRVNKTGTTRSLTVQKYSLGSGCG
jgi:hypothetical protein